jgi:hypothetical protein
MLNVEGAALERLVHTAIFTTTCSPGFDLPRPVSPRHHEGVHPSKYSAWARTRESCSLSSTSASNSVRSASVKSPSVLRSMSCCNRSFARDGNRSSPTDSTHSTGAATVAPISNTPCKAKQMCPHGWAFPKDYTTRSPDSQIRWYTPCVYQYNPCIWFRALLPPAWHPFFRWHS